MSGEYVPVGNQVIPSLSQLAQVGMGMDGPGGKDMRSFLRQMMLASGLNTIHVVNNTQAVTGWVENNNGVFDIAAGAGDRVETNEIQMTSTGTCDGTQFLQLDNIYQSAAIPPDAGSAGRKQMDWTDTRYIGFWVNNQTGGDFSTAGELKITIVNNGVEQDQVNLQAQPNDVHQWFEIDMVAEGWDRNAVESMRFYANVASGEDIFINEITRYEISYDRGPLYGCMWYVGSGVTLTENDLVGWEIDGLVASAGSAVVGDLGPVKLFKNGLPVASATGDAAHTVWGMVPGLFLFIGRSNGSCTAGDQAEWASARHLTDVTTTTTGLGVAVAMETDGAAEDDILFNLNKVGQSA